MIQYIGLQALNKFSKRLKWFNCFIYSFQHCCQPESSYLFFLFFEEIVQEIELQILS